jgi:hypothetical protein
MHSVLSCHNVTRYVQFYLGLLQSNVTATGNANVSKRALQCYSKRYSVASVKKLLHLKVYKLSIVQGVGV